MSKINVVKEIGRKIGLKLVGTENLCAGANGFEFDANDNVVKLAIQNVGITELPDELGELTELTEIRISKTKIKELPKTIGNLTKLKVLDLDKNELHALPHQIGNLKELTLLNIYQNHIEVIPDEIKNLEKLEVFLAGENKIKFVPKGVSRLSNLKRLGLTNNHLEDFPRELLYMGIDVYWSYDPFTYGVFLGGNPIKQPPKQIIKMGRSAILSYFKNTSPYGSMVL